MIRAKEGEIDFKGTLDTLLSEYAVITREFRGLMEETFESEEEAQRLIKRGYDIGCMTDEEIDKEIKLAKENFEKSGIGKVLSTLFGGMKHDAD